MDGWMDGQEDRQKGSGLRDQRKIHEIGGTESCLSVETKVGGSSHKSITSQELPGVHGPWEEAS